AALVFNRSDTPTYAGVISGTGTLAQSGTGTLTLTGTNTYTGATTINAGTLALSGTGSVATSSQVNVANAAGTFDISAPTAAATPLTVPARRPSALAARALNRSDTPTSAAVISRTATLPQRATGTHTLTGTNTFTGATTINGGTLALSVAGSVATSSQVNVAN